MPAVAATFELHLTNPGSIANLVVREQHLTQRAARWISSQVELRVQATGLNFRDVLNILYLDPTRSVRPLGLECASIAAAVSKDVAHFKGGDNIYGLSEGCLASMVQTDARILVRMPFALSFEQASTLPILWCTIRVALAECMHTSPRPLSDPAM